MCLVRSIAAYFCFIDGHHFYMQRTVAETCTQYFICSRYRAGRKARLIVRHDEVKQRGFHNCEDQLPPCLTHVRKEMREAL